MSLFPNMKISEAFFAKCKEGAQKSVRYFYDDLKFEKSVFVKEWGLYVPNNINELLREGGEDLV